MSGAEETPLSQSEAREQYAKVSSLGRNILSVTRDRKTQRWAPYLSLEAFPSEHVKSVSRAKEGPLKQEDVRAARIGSFGIALSAAEQIRTVRFPRHGGVRESTRSLAELQTVIRRGHTFLTEMLRSDPSVVHEEAREIQARLLGKDLSELDLDNAALETVAQDTFKLAERRLGRARAALQRYLGV